MESIRLIDELLERLVYLWPGLVVNVLGGTSHDYKLKIVRDNTYIISFCINKKRVETVRC